MIAALDSAPWWGPVVGVHHPIEDDTRTEAVHRTPSRARLVVEHVAHVNAARAPGSIPKGSAHTLHGGFDPSRLAHGTCRDSVGDGYGR